MTSLPVSGAMPDAGSGTSRVAQFMTGKANPIVVTDRSHQMLCGEIASTQYQSLKR